MLGRGGYFYGFGGLYSVIEVLSRWKRVFCVVFKIISDIEVG